jgi:hypothetical protein
MLTKSTKSIKSLFRNQLGKISKRANTKRANNALISKKLTRANHMFKHFTPIIERIFKIIYGALKDFKNYQLSKINFIVKWMTPAKDT